MNLRIQSFLKKIWQEIFWGGIRPKLLALLCIVVFLIFTATLVGVFLLHLDFSDAIWWAWTHLLDAGFVADDDSGCLRRIIGSVFAVAGLLVIGGAFLALAEEAARSTVERLINGQAPKQVNNHTIIAGKGSGKIAACFNALPDHPKEEKVIITVPDYDELIKVRSARLPANIIVGRLDELNLLEAQRFVLLENYVDNAGEVLAILNSIYEMIDKRHASSTLQIYIEMNNSALAAMLQIAIRRLDRSRGKIHFHLLNIYGASARLALKNHPLDYSLILPGRQSRVTIIIEGWTAFAQALFWQALRTDHYPVKPTRIIVVHPEALKIESEVISTAPGLSDEWVRSSLTEVSFLEKYYSGACGIEKEDSLTWAVCYENPDQNFARGLALQERFLPGLHQIYIELPSNSGYRSVVQKMNSDVRGEQRVSLVAVGPSEEAIDFEEKLDKLAKAIHTHYQNKYGGVSWEELDETKRAWNRSPADHADVKLRALKGMLQAEHPEDDPAGVEARLKNLVRDLSMYPENGLDGLGSYIDVLSRLEHDRWCAEKYAEGWSYSKNRDNLSKKHPLLVTYDALPRDEQLKDWETMKIVLNNQWISMGGNHGVK